MTFVPNPAASDFHEFEKELDWAAMTDDLAAVQEVMQRSKLNRLTDRYAFSVEEAQKCTRDRMFERQQGAGGVLA